jgi:hypothetical protein
MACRVPLEDIAAMTDSHRVSALVEKPLISLLENDCNGAYLLIVLGDGFDPDDGKKAREAMVQIAVLVLTLAVTMLPEPLEITSAWIVGGGRALEVRVFDVDEEGVSIGTREHGPITPVTATRVMAQAVHAGVMVPQDSPIEHWYAVGRGLAGSRTRGRTLRAADVGAALTELPALLGGVRDAEPTMSECERLVSLMRYLGRRDCWWDVLALVLARGTAGPELDDDLVGALVKDPRHRPQGDVVAGGSLYGALDDLHSISEGMVRANPDPVLVSARAGIGAILLVLAWWNHRYATAGHRADELRAAGEQEDLALLLTQMVDSGLSPAWTPRT